MLHLDFSPFPLLVTERLTLRQVTTGDAKDIFGLRSDKEIMKYLDRPLATSIEETTQWIEKNTETLHNNDAVLWGITLKNDPALIGTIGFWRIDKENQRAEIGYLLHTSHQGKGLMQEAMTAALHYGFTTMKLHSVEANVNPHNFASMRLLEKKGFIREAYFKENYFFNGKFLDSVIYSLLTPVN